MTAAVLFVSRSGSDELRFILQRRDAAEPVVMEARITLDEEQRRNITRTLEPFAECVRGFPQDEAKFRDIGTVLYSIALPQLIRKQLSDIDVPVTILTDDPTLPWEILHDGNDFLSLRLPIARQLIFEAQLAGYLRPLDCEIQGFSALVIADPTEDLPGARLEGKALHKLFDERGDSQLLIGRCATWSNIQSKLVQRPYSVIHVCSHVDYDHDRRQHSIRLRDGWLSSDDVLPTFKGRPLVFLNSCYSDIQVQTEAMGARTESLARAFMVGNENGAASAVVGTMWRIPDEPADVAMEFSRVFYRHLIDGGAIGEAMRRSRKVARSKNCGPIVWSPYVIYGDPTQVPFGPNDREATSSDGVQLCSTGETTGHDIQPTKEANSAPTPRASEAECTETNPLDTSARKVLRIALREMSELDNNLLSSIHILIGMCKAPVRELKHMLHANRIDLEDLCKEARRQAKQLPLNKGHFGISVSTAQVLLTATRHANRTDRDRVSGFDLLVGMLSVQHCHAVRMLTKFGIQNKTISAHVGTDTGQIQLEWFDDTTREAMMYANKLSHQGRIGFVPTPHLLVGLVRTGASIVRSVLQERGIDPDDLCAQLTLVDEPAPSSVGNTESLFPATPRMKRIINRARRHSRDGTDQKICERVLLQAIMEERVGFTHTQLSLVGLHPEELLETLRLGKS